MRIAITVDPFLPVPPTLYGGIERVVDFVVRGMIESGHEVSLIAHPDSKTPARLFSYGAPPHTGLRCRLQELYQVGSTLRSIRKQVDVIHSFGRLAALLPILHLRQLPKIQSYQRDGVPWRSVRVASKMGGRSMFFTGCSTNVFRKPASQGPLIGSWRTIYNGVDLSKYTFRSETNDDAPVAFLGRLERIKGAHHAIAIAAIARRNLIIAGNIVNSGPEANYFENEIAPHIDGHAVTYLGPINDMQKNELLGKSAALLMPIEWEEPFGIVMVEAFACGTPVIAFQHGSVPEIVRDRINGFTATNVNEAAQKMLRIGEISRKTTRNDCEERFSHKVIVREYEKLYSELITRSKANREFAAKGNEGIS